MNLRRLAVVNRLTIPLCLTILYVSWVALGGQSAGGRALSTLVFIYATCVLGLMWRLGRVISPRCCVLHTYVLGCQVSVLAGALIVAPIAFFWDLGTRQFALLIGWTTFAASMTAVLNATELSKRIQREETNHGH